VTVLVDTLNTLGISAFGIGMPVLAPRWTDSQTPTVNDAAMSLELAGGTWLSPAAGTLLAVQGSAIGVTLVHADGAIAAGPGLLLTLFPQVYLRLRRLYAQTFEVAGRPERDQGLPVRPVPRYFLYAGAVDAADVSGDVTAGAELGQSGELTIYDDAGTPLDPLAVAAAFQAIMTRHQALQQRTIGAPFDPNPQVQTIAGLGGGTPVVRLRLADPAGKPYDGAHLVGLTAFAAGAGLFTLNAAAGGGSDLSGAITKAAGTGATGDFPDETRRLLLLGPATTGRLGERFAPPALPGGVSLARDFLAVRVIQLRPFLLGVPEPGFDGTKVEKQPAVRIHEPLNLLADGNDVLAAAAGALAGAQQESLCVAQQLSGSFPVPATTGADAHWPSFPPPVGTPAPSGALPVNLRDGFQPTAAFLDDGDPATANVDVVLTLNGLPPAAAVRVYPRKFVEDAREARGDGAGGVVPASGTLTLLLRDPLALRRPGIPDAATIIPPVATLRCDVMVLKRTGEARLYGNVAANIGTTTTPAPPLGGSNPFGTAARRGVSNAGILGLGTHLGSLPSDPLQAVLALAGEGNPRDAPRFPTMARRDLLVAGLADGNWRAALSAGRLAPETHSAAPRLGAPGGLGGRETQTVGVSTQNVRLAYDIARMAFRRTTNIVTRMIELANDRWNEPAQPAELPSDAAPTASAGTFAGAVLQTIAPFCETPELQILKPLIDPQSTTRPTSFNGLVDFLTSNLLPAGVPFRAQLVNALNTLKDNDTLNESTRERLFNELERELMASIYGRRDAQWALKQAIANARRFIYIESPGFAATQKKYPEGTPVPPYAVDLPAALATRLRAASGLHVMICTPKYPDFAPGYEPMAANEAADRQTTILGLPTASDLTGSRVVAFHPIGFPGRASRLEATVVIVDDVWAFIGASTFRRRGLTFDGGSDLVLTDTQLRDGRSPAIAGFRRDLMAARLGIGRESNSALGAMPDPGFVRLADGVEALHVIRERLLAGGLGTIDRLWNGQTPGVTPIDPGSISRDLANPEGQEFDLVSALLLQAIADLNAF
jgi:hypothetical protein